MKQRSRSRRSVPVAAAMLALLQAVSPGQGGSTPVGPHIPIDPVPHSDPLVCPNTVIAYVDPITGDDVPTSTIPYNELIARLNNKALPFRTIQRAIDACQLGVSNYYVNPSLPGHLDAQGLVICMPGLYGPTGVQAAPKDVLPILMRDRVSIQGTGARRTILRGGQETFRTVFWPDADTCGSYQEREVLIDFVFEQEFWGGANPLVNDVWGNVPWVGTGNTEEMIDGLTLQLGDVQVYFGDEGPANGRISNCIFDMRPIDEAMTGPYFGILLRHQFDLGHEDGYWDTPFNILNNTFVLGEAMSGDSLLARPEAVAICDVVDPNCLGTPDSNLQLRGFAKLSIQNNLIRCLPEQTGQRVLLGIDSEDVEVRVSPAGGTNPGPTNAFHLTRVGGTNGVFFSDIVGLSPVPAVDLGVAAGPAFPNDPPFVGEALAPILVAFPDYRDWRLLPSSPTTGAVNAMQDAGSSPLAGGTLTAENGTTYTEPVCVEYSSFDWDGEHYGNPRRVGAEVDIGFDEVHGFIMAGVWANDTNNHNTPDPVIDPNGGQGAGRRFMLFPETFVGQTATVNGVLPGYVVVPPIAAWITPPGTVAPPVVNGTLPVDYRQRYIPFTNPAPTPTPWAGPIGASQRVSPISLQSFRFGVRVQVDVEGPPPCRYFDAQVVIVSGGGTTSWTNLQAEYR